MIYELSVIEIIVVCFLMFSLGVILGYFWGKENTEKKLHVITGKSAKKFYEETGLGDVK